MTRRTTRLLLGIAALLGMIESGPSGSGAEPATERSIPVAVVQFDAVPEAIQENLDKMERLARQAAKKGVRWVVFHEGAVCDYTDKLEQLAETVPDGKSTRQLEALAKELGCYLSFGLSEKDQDRSYITQVFVGPKAYFYRYRKTWLHRDPTDTGFRNEYARYDPGTGPELFAIDRIRATCFICADATAPRCLHRAAALRPQVVFHPINVVTHDAQRLREREAGIAKTIGAPLIMPNRVGDSWSHKAGQGGAAIFSASGEILAEANGKGEEEIVIHRLVIPERKPE